MDQENFLLDLIDKIYMAGLGETSWDAVTGPLCDVTGCPVVSIHMDDLKRERSILVSPIGLDPGEVEKYETYYVMRNPWMLRIVPYCASGKLVFGEEFVTKRELRRTEFYNDWLRPNNVVRSMAVCLHKEPHLFGFLTLLQPPQKDGFPAHDVKLVRSLIPHLRRATAINQTFQQLRVERWLAEHALDALACGAVILDWEARILFANRAMLEILAQRDGICVRHRRLCFLHRAVHALSQAFRGTSRVRKYFRMLPLRLVSIW